MTNEINTAPINHISALQEQLQRAQDALNEETKYRVLFETLTQGVIYWDRQGRPTTANAAAEKILGLSLMELQNKHEWRITREDGSTYSSDHWPVISPLETGHPVRDDCFAITNQKDGRQRWIKVSTIPQFIPGDDRPCGAFSTFEDITAQRQAQNVHVDLEMRVRERTVQLEAMIKELETFSYSVSHDLRAPLRTIDGFSLAVLEDYGDVLDAEGQNYLQRVRAAAKQMGQLIDDLLKLSRVTRGELHRESVNLTQMAHAAVLALKHSDPDRKLTVKIDDDMVVHADPRLLRVTLDNLLDNAWKFTSRLDNAEIHVGVRISDGKTVYFVRDNGAGFNMSYASKLFGPFQRLHTEQDYKGSGMGLATVQRIIRRHGGQIWAESEEGNGATFYFTLENSTAYERLEGVV